MDLREPIRRLSFPRCQLSFDVLGYSGARKAPHETWPFTKNARIPQDTAAALRRQTATEGSQIAQLAPFQQDVNGATGFQGRGAMGIRGHQEDRAGPPLSLDRMMTRPFLPVSLLAAALLSGCMAAPMTAEPDVPYNPPLGGVAVAPVAGVSGLEERQPDLCGAKNYTSALGQPASIIPTLGLTKEYRIVEFRGIEPQNYIPNRIVFRLDAGGLIQNIDCG